MKLQTKISLAILPLVIASIVILGVWSYLEAKSGVQQAVHQYLETVLKAFVAENLDKPHKILDKNKLASIQSFVDDYKKRAVSASKEVNLKKHGHFFALSPSGEVIFCSLQHKKQSLAKKWEIISNKTIQKYPQILHGEIDGESDNEVFVAYYFEPWKWTVFLAIPQKRAYASLSRIKNVTIAIAISCGVISVAMIFLMLRYFFVSPLIKLKSAAGRIAGGDLKTPLQPPPGKDEINQLATSLEKMRESLNDLFERTKKTDELARLNTQLEQEIIERSQVEEKLRVEKDRVQQYLDIAGVMIIVINREQKVLLINKKGCEILGYAEEEIIGKNWFDNFLPQDQGEQVKKVFDSLMSGNVEAFNFYENEVTTKSGQRRAVAWYNFLITDEYGNIAGTISSGEDITDRKRAEKALQDSEEKFSRAFKTAPYAITITGIDDGRFLEVNDAFAQISGYTRQEALTNSSIGLEIWVNPGDRQRVIEDLKAGHAVMAREYPFRTKNGEIITGLFSAQTITFNNGFFILSSINDITERKIMEEERRRLEEQLRQSQKLESIGTLAGGVAHDFNNILSAIIGYTELTLDDLPKESSVRDNLDQVLKSSWRARNLVSQLLAFSRKQVLEMKTFTFNDLIKQNQSMLTRIIGEDIELNIHLAADAGFIRADFNQIEQVLLNLVANARDAMPDGGKLTMETKNVYLDTEYTTKHTEVEPGSYVMLAVSDNGQGIDRQNIEKIFEPFFTTKETGKGTGMGLATVHGIVKQHGGTIYVYSELGHGTTFKVYLPRVEHKPELIIEREEISDLVGGTETILVVEDEDVVREFVVKTLEKLGYDVLKAENGPDALSLMREGDCSVDLLLTDVIMPRMNGKEVFERLSKDNPSLKVLYISGYTDNVIAHHGVLDEGVAFLQKPLSISALANKIRQVLGATKKL